MRVIIEEEGRERASRTGEGTQQATDAGAPAGAEMTAAPTDAPGVAGVAGAIDAGPPSRELLEAIGSQPQAAAESTDAGPPRA